MISSFPLPLVYHSMIVEHLIGEGGGGGSGVISSSPLPLVYHYRIVGHLIGEEGVGSGLINSARCHWYIITWK